MDGFRGSILGNLHTSLYINIYIYIYIYIYNIYIYICRDLGLVKDTLGWPSPMSSCVGPPLDKS